MPIEITVPRLGWTMEEGTFVGWLKQDGEPVRSGEPLFTLDGDKALQDVEAIDSGILRIPPDGPKPGSTVRVGALLGFLMTGNEAGNPSEPAAPIALEIPTPSPKALAALSSSLPTEATQLSRAAQRLAVTPRALRAAVERNIDWAGVRGTGRGGRIRERDILAVASFPERPKIIPASSARVVITDWTFPDLAVEEGILKPLGHEVVSYQCKTEAELILLVGDADCVITQFGRLSATVVAAMAKARAIVRYGIGVDNVDLEAARGRGIPVCNVPDYCIDEVADQTLAFILAATRQVVPHTNRVRDGQWGLAVPLGKMQALRDLTVGVVGLGRIGREVVRRLAPFKCQVLAFDPVVSAADVERAGARAVASFDELLGKCDVLTLHCPSTPQTRRLVNSTALARLKPGAILINVARGDLVDTAALVEALRSGRLAAAALDVCDPEPIPGDHPLLKLPGVILAPHIASTSLRAVKKLRETVATLAASAVRGELPANVVNGVSVPRLLS